jgi:hypothetical protein
MAHLIGLFERGGSYYLRVVLPQHHPLRSRYRSGKVVQSLGKCSYRDAMRIGTQKRAEVLWGSKSPGLAPTGQVEPQPNQPPILTLTGLKPSVSLREVYELWIKSSPKSADAVYTHIDAGTLKAAIETLMYQCPNTRPILPHLRATDECDLF